MKVTLIAVLLSGLSFVATPRAEAQTGPAFPSARPGSSEAGARRSSGTINADELARNQRRAAMTPDEIKRDQQLELLEARTGNTSFGRTGGPERQFDKSSGGFMVRKFKTQPGKPGYAEQKRGMSHTPGSANPAGKPLVHKHGRKRFLLF